MLESDHLICISTKRNVRLYGQEYEIRSLKGWSVHPLWKEPANELELNLTRQCVVKIAYMLRKSFNREPWPGWRRVKLVFKEQQEAKEHVQRCVLAQKMEMF